MGPNLGPSPAEDGIAAFDETYERTTDSGIQVRFGFIYERDPRRGEALERRQAAVLHKILLWKQRCKDEVAAGIRCPGRTGTGTGHCTLCRNQKPGSGERCTRERTDCPCGPYHRETNV
jgi:hypothetical protein